MMAAKRKMRALMADWRRQRSFFEVADLVDSKGGSFNGLASADGGTTWTLNFTPNEGKLGPAAVAVSGAYTDLAGNAGQGSAALPISYFAAATATDGYLRGADIRLDVDDSGTVTAGIFDLAVSGRGTIFGTRYNHNLATVGNYQSKLVYGVDYKAYKSSLELFDVQLGNDITVHPISLGYQGTWVRVDGDANIGLSLLDHRDRMVMPARGQTVGKKTPIDRQWGN